MAAPPSTRTRTPTLPAAEGVPAGVGGAADGDAATMDPHLPASGPTLQTVIPRHLPADGPLVANPDGDLPPPLEASPAGNHRRVVRPPQAAPDWSAEPGLDRMLAFLETKTVWHPVGT